MSQRSREIFSVVCREPYRLFFPLGVLIGIIGIGHWLCYSIGWLKAYSGFYHSSIQMTAYMSCFVVGFLLTAMPRFSNTFFTTFGELLVFFLLILGIFVFLTVGWWVTAEFFFIALLLALGRFATKRFSKKRETAASPPTELIWIPIALFHGITGTLLLILGQIKFMPGWAILVGKPMMEQGFILSIVVGIGGFLIPRLMGTFEAAGSKEACVLEEAVLRKRRSALWQLGMGLLFFASFWLEGLGKIALGYGLRALVITSQFFRNGLLPKPPRVPYLFVRLVWISAWMVLLGMWMTAFLPDYRVVTLHLIFIGGLSLMAFSIATMVVMSHAGEGEKLRGPIWILWVIGAGISLALFKRVAAVFLPDAYFQFLGLAAFFWILTGIGWLCFAAPRIAKVTDEGEFERAHEQAKKEILQKNKG